MARVVNGFGGHPLDAESQVNSGALVAGVKFANREPASTTQKLLAVVFSLVVLAIPVMLIAAAASANVELRALGDTSPCSSSFVGYPSDQEPVICISKSLMSSLSQCQQQQEAITGRRLEDSFDNQKGIFALLASPAVFVYFIMILVASIAWLLALRMAASFMIWGTVLISIAVCGYAYYLTSNWMFLVGIGIIALLSFTKKDAINKGCVSVATALEATAETKYSLITLVVIEVVALALSVMIIGIISVSSRIYVVDAQCQLHMASLSFQGPLAFIFFLVFNFFNMAACYSLSFAIGCWYFHSTDAAAPAMPIVAGAQQAFFSMNGIGVCVQASVVMSIVDYLQNKTKASKSWKACCDPTWCLAMLLVSCFRQCLESLSKFAVVAVALAGGSFCETSRKAMATLGAQRTADFVIIDGVISSVLHLMATAFATVFAIAAWATVDSVENLGIFNAIVSGTEDVGNINPKAAQWIVVFIILCFIYFIQRPFFTMAIILIVNSYFPIENTLAASALAALIVGSVASLVFHYFADCVIGAQCAMFYCWSLDSVCNGESETPGRNRKKVADMWAQQQALNVSEAGFLVTCPPGMTSGSRLQVTSPTGQTLEVTVPPGISAGQNFMVQC